MSSTTLALWWTPRPRPRAAAAPATPLRRRSSSPSARRFSWRYAPPATLHRATSSAPELAPHRISSQAYELRGAGAVLHSHALEALLATLLEPGSDAFRVSHLEMIKGLAGHGYGDELVIPIIENTAREHQLTASLREAIAAYPAAPAVLVRRHGVYVWGVTWQAAKTQAECLHYLFQCAIEARKLGMPPLLGVPQAPGAASAAAALAGLSLGGGGAQAGPPRHLVLELDDWSLLASGAGPHDDVAPLLSRAAAAGVRVTGAAACVARATQRALLSRAAPADAAKAVALFCAGDTELEATSALFEELELALGGSPRDSALVVSASRAAAAAAHAAGWRVALVLRGGAEVPSDLPADIAVVTSLADVKLPA